MHIVLLTFDFAPDIGGVQRYLHEITRRLARRHQVTVITPVPAEGPEPYRRVVVPRSRWDLWLRALIASRPDRVLVGHAHPRLLLAAALARPRRFIVFTHGNDFLAAQRKWHHSLFNALLRFSPRVLTNSPGNARRLRALGVNRVTVVYPGTDPTTFTPPDVPPPFPPVLLTVGRLVPRKGVDTVLRALPLLLPRYPEVRYRIVGSGPDQARLVALTRRLRLQERVDFVGRVPDETLPSTYRSAHIFVMPVREEKASTSVEGFGIVFLEAAASGLPVVTSEASGIAEEIRRRNVGLLVPPDDPSALAHTLASLLDDPMRRARLGKAGRRWVEREMTWEHTAERVMHIVEAP